jgi:hypothetical protein
MRLQLLAMTAPRSIKLNQPHLIGVQNLLFEIGRREHFDFGSC